MRRQGLPMPPYNPILGHLPVVINVMSKIPGDSHNQYLPSLLRRAYPDLGPNFYMDTWPFGSPVLFICEPIALHQITQEHSLPKHPDLREFLRPLANGLDIVTMEGQQWKTWRNIFNPGFSLAHLMTLTPLIINETAIFCDILKERAEEAKIFAMKSLTDRWTMDIIGNVVLETNLNTQQADNPMVNALKRQIRWLVFGSKLNPWERWHPFRSLVHRYCSYQINSYINADLDRHIANFRVDTNTTSKSIVGLAMQTYLAEDTSKKSIDDTFRVFALSQIKQFLFSGHDTTSSTMCYIFYVLSMNPEIKQRVENEHNKSLGLTLESKSSRLKEKPHLLNQLPYTTAVLKETMRLYPVASSLRGGEPGFCVRDPEGRSLPTDGFLVWAVSQPLHRDPNYWVRPETFIPDRWLVGPEDPLYPIKGAWRPFEYGPRNCIGQELALMELKVAMVFVLHTFDVEVAYAQFDLENPRNLNTVSGERAYQLTLAGPSDGLPCKVKVKQSTA
ncbi:MAG: hypothetical protein L6R38_006969 [Xanthoria sp. 2 TBL-2021]|nr:MAG: hypothetical protein L6R38_006969 [Xanthoria sp. 2 TBL-2021]